MANLAFGYTNLADSGSVTATSQQILLPASNVLNEHVGKRWRSSTNNDSIVIDLGSSQSIDTVWFGGLTGSAATTTARVRIATVDVTGVAGDAYDSGTLSDGGMNLDVAYSSGMVLISSPVTGRYVRIDLADSAGSYVEIGRVFVGARTAMSRTFSLGWQRQWIDRSTTSETRGGQTLILKDTILRSLVLSLDNVTEAEKNGVIEDIDRLNGQSTDILVITDPDSTNLPRDSLWGLVRDLTPVIQPQWYTTFSKQFSVKERL